MALAVSRFALKMGWPFIFIRSIHSALLLYKRMNFFRFCPDKLLFSMKSSNNVGFVYGEKKLFSSTAYLWTSHTLIFSMYIVLATRKIEEKSQIFLRNDWRIRPNCYQLNDNCENTWFLSTGYYLGKLLWNLVWCGS